MSNGKMLAQLRKMAGDKDISTDSALQLTLSSNADILESIDNIKDNNDSINGKVEKLNVDVEKLNVKVNNINDGVLKYHDMVETLQKSFLVKLSVFIDNNKKVALIIGVIMLIFVIPEIRQVLIAWLLEQANI